MKFFIFTLLIIAIYSQNILPGYIINSDQSGQIRPAASKELYSSQSLTELLKHNLQILENSDNFNGDLIQEFGKGNLLNPVQLNYIFAIEGQDQPENHLNHAKFDLQVDNNSKKLLDEIFGANNSIAKLVRQYYPKEKRQSFYYYQSQGVQSESIYEKAYGIEIKRDVSNNKLYIFDNQSQKQIGQQFELSNCFAENFPEYLLSQEQIVKKNSGLKLKINEQNAKDVEIFMKDLCATTKLSQMFQKSVSPNFIVFAMNYKNLQDNALIQDLIKNQYKKVQNNFSDKIGVDSIQGQIVYVEDVQTLQSRKVSNARILIETHQSNVDYSSKQFQFWFTLLFIITLAAVSYSLFNMEIQRDTLLYAKFIHGDTH